MILMNNILFNYFSWNCQFTKFEFNFASSRLSSSEIRDMSTPLPVHQQKHKPLKFTFTSIPQPANVTSTNHFEVNNFFPDWYRRLMEFTELVLTLILKQLCLLHFVSFFLVASLLSISFLDNKKSILNQCLTFFICEPWTKNVLLIVRKRCT